MLHLREWIYQESLNDQGRAGEEFHESVSDIILGYSGKWLSSEIQQSDYCKGVLNLELLALNDVPSLP